jgi:superfamily II DNA or RNA helicase
MMARASERGMSSFFIVHQNELLSQTAKALWKQKLEHGMIASGKRVSKLPAQVASVQTLVRRTDRYDPPALIIIDEAHRAAASTYLRILEAYPNALVIGLTATPQRTDGKGLGDIFQHIVQGPSIRQLIDAGYLCDYEILAPPSQVDTSNIKTQLGDYNKAQLQAEVDKPTITGDAVSHYIKHATGKRCVVMCVSLKHADHVAEQYRNNGVAAEVIDGRKTDPEREAILKRFETGQTKLLCNVQLMIEGVDIPAIQVVQWLRPTQSLIVWMQGNGRGLRPAQGKDRLLILDHVGNWTRHGLPDEDREWSLESTKRKKRKTDEEPDVLIQQCKECFHVLKPGVDACPRCGAPVVRKVRAEIQVVDAELERIDIEAERKQKRRETGMARTLEELIKLGVRRGLNKPAAWAAITIAAREGRKPTREEFSEARRIHREVMAA